MHRFGTFTVKPLTIAAVVAGCLLLLTLADAAWRRSSPDSSRPVGDATQASDATEPARKRCAIYHARFGGQRAQLVRAMREGVANFVVLEMGKRDPVLRVQRTLWLRAAYGEVEHAWLGEFSSAEAAMARAALFCPPALRCWPGEAGCGPKDQLLTPTQAFFAH